MISIVFIIAKETCESFQVLKKNSYIWWYTKDCYPIGDDAVNDVLELLTDDNISQPNYPHPQEVANSYISKPKLNINYLKSP